MSSRFVAIPALLLVSGSSYAFEFSFKGMVKTELLHTNSAVASYGTAYSQVAPTNALRRDLFGGSPATEQEMRFLNSEATSFQAAHSRFSLNMKHNKVRTVLEFDFIDGEDGFTNQTAIQAQEPRLRLATLYYDHSDEWTFFGGQKWTTAAGIKSFGTYNWIGNTFRAGNTGFLSMEIGGTYKSEGLAVTGAITGKGRNATAQGINANELGSEPGLALDINYSFSGNKVGFAGHVAEVKYEDDLRFVSGENQDANLFKVYGIFKFGDVTLNAEAYTGESINNLNSLGIAPASRIGGDGVVRESFDETGYFAYLNWNINSDHNLKAGYGSAEVDSSDRARLSITELSKNSTAYAAYSYKLVDSLTLFAQVTYFDTEFGVDFEDFSAVETRLGALFKF